MVQPAEQVAQHSWGMVVDVDRCTGCQACVVACQAENNQPLNLEEHFLQGRAFEWIRVERYWEGEYPNIKARFIPVLCQHCENAPCEPVCPVYATYHNDQGMNVQVYNRCVGTRYCANGCPYQVRFFNYWEPVWPVELRNQLNPDVTVRSRGVMEKCSFCIQRIRRTRIQAKREDRQVRDGEIQPACVQACPTNTLTFGDLNDPTSRVSRLKNDRRAYRLLHETLNTDPHLYYLARVYNDQGEAAHG
ncbi:MAG: 4Fe-4S dicluster domain-containing protein, partial [Chloroflexi bacterium]|nr:4Fe-4S dicluster domain-containing protein [Chloroflexota bacterium]